MPDSLKKISSAFVLAPLMLLSYFLRALPPALFNRAGAGLGWLLYALHFRRRIVMSNLRLAFGPGPSDAELADLARRNFRYTGCLFLEIARNFAFTNEQMRREVVLSDSVRERIGKALARGKGIVFVSGHIGNWELLAMGVAAHGFPSAIVVKKMNNPLSQALIERQRRRTGLGVIYSGGTVQKMKAALNAGTVIGFMMDQNVTGKKGIRCNFFGVPAASIRALGALARDSGTAVMPMCVFRQPDGTQKVHLEDELPYLQAEELTGEERVLREEWLNAQQYQAAIEKLVRMHPEQWLWIHRRWKTDRTPLDPATAHLENK